MKLSSSILIDKPISEVWVYLNDLSKMKNWQKGYTSTEVISGKPAEKGSSARHTYTERGKPFVMTETVIDSHPPHSIDIQLEHPTMTYQISTRLREESPQKTKVQMDSLVHMKAFSFKVLKPLLKAPFQKRQDGDLLRLKQSMEAE